jgi:hypothetical protein
MTSLQESRTRFNRCVEASALEGVGCVGGQRGMLVKRVVSIGPGSSTRDHRVQVELLGQQLILEKIGTDGDLGRVNQLLRELDGEVDAFGLANIDLHLHAGGRIYTVRDAVRLTRGVTRTPIVDGGGLKASWERWLVTEHLPARGIDLHGRRVLVVSSVDRYGLASAFVDVGADVMFGDLIFSMGLPIGLRSLRTVRLLGAAVLPVTTKLPFRYFYPLGDKQDQIVPRHHRFYRWAQVVAGDFHYIRRTMPDDLADKIVITQTVTPQDVAELRQRGVRTLVTDFPRMDGRSFATNVLQAAVVALLARPPETITGQEYVETLLRAGVEPSIEHLNPGSAS